MAILVALEHRTTYKFDRLVEIGPHVVRLRPAPENRIPIRSYSLTVSPANHYINWQQDVFGNHMARLVFPERANELTITVDLVADLTVINPFDFFVEESAERYPFDYGPDLANDLTPYLRAVQDSAAVRQWLASVDLPGEKSVPIVDFLVEVNRKVANAVAYTVRMEAGVQTPSQTLQAALGSCRDSAWLLVAALRELGLAARFVSGYLVQLAADDRSGGGPTEDFTDLHAWAEVYVPGAGWIGLDATSGLFAGEGHIPLSATPEPAGSAAITGTIGPAITTMEFHNVVRRVHEDPRVTKPYTDSQWDAVDRLGIHVDELLKEHDVRLTMGGEPTFVAIDDMESEQWGIAADGPDKRLRALELSALLKDHYAPHGIVHHGQGKWYPGEPLPRWQIAILWRTDGEPLWHNAELLDDPWSEATLPPSSPEASDRAALLAAEIAAGVGVPRDYVLPAYDDPLDKLANEVRLPVGDDPIGDIDPASPALADPAQRADLVARVDVEVGDPVAWVFPLHRTDKGDEWGTAKWQTRRERLILIGGSSPAGLRLPLDAISWTPPPLRPERSTFLPAPALPIVSMTGEVPPAVISAVEDVPPTALCIQERDGHLFVFLPPLESFDDAVLLLGAIERAAIATNTPVVLEGYLPPGDPRANNLTVTPDPGVIEVNVQPSSSWRELVEITETIHTAAKECLLGTEKFALDGIHTGTGGGSHITLGGAVPSESPLLRRPDLLVSLLTFWQHHPSLSYLFSGRFVGPSSQAPRVDEGRHETLYELEIAFSELKRFADDPVPWRVDRLLRHLLTDLTGNTHRAEFCIDKLYSPDSARGRLGLLELRGFEMPPHAQMSLVQALLVRSMVARMWQTPYTGPLVRWGTELHDRFLLPAYVAADIADVVADLRAHGLNFEFSWLEPFLEFRFPRLGSIDIDGVHLELRQGIEPWHVLGEEVSSGGTARYVDSSVERLQVQLTGATATRHVLTCNGIPVPLRSTGTPGTEVAGIRYKAWAPYSALHPTIEIHSPLVFDLVDRWNGRSLGGCTYHVVHPGGRSYDTFPVNASEAEARRSSRFVRHGHTPGPIDMSTWGQAAAGDGYAGDYPHTLDLRRAGSTP